MERSQSWAQVDQGRGEAVGWGAYHQETPTTEGVGEGDLSSRAGETALAMYMGMLQLRP